MAWTPPAGWEGTPAQAAAAGGGGGGSSTPAGTFLDVATAGVSDGSGVTFSQVGSAVQGVSEAMVGSASTKPSLLQEALFWDTSIQAQNIHTLNMEILPTVTVEEASNITAPVIIAVGWVSVPDGGVPSLANLATHKSRWMGFRINGPSIQVDPGQDDGNFSWSGNFNLDVTEPTDYTWLTRLMVTLWKTLASTPVIEFADLRALIEYAGTDGAHTIENVQTEQSDDTLNADDTIWQFFGMGRQATGGSSRTVALEVDSIAAAKAS